MTPGARSWRLPVVVAEALKVPRPTLSDSLKASEVGVALRTSRATDVKLPPTRTGARETVPLWTSTVPDWSS